jgi:putative hydrolase of the HAD superfamily
MIKKLAIDYIEHLSDFNHLIPDTILILDYLHLKYNMHIITNGFKEVQRRKLEKSDLLKYFSTITISEDVGVKKPDEIIFKHALQKSNSLIENSVMIGDNYNADILGANNIGMKSIYFNFHKTQEEQKKDVVVIQDLKEILEIL